MAQTMLEAHHRWLQIWGVQISQQHACFRLGDIAVGNLLLELKQEPHSPLRSPGADCRTVRYQDISCASEVAAKRLQPIIAQQVRAMLGCIYLAKLPAGQADTLPQMTDVPVHARKMPQWRRLKHGQNWQKV